jgi:AMMECR1 domain-containing protein
VTSAAAGIAAILVMTVVTDPALAPYQRFAESSDAPRLLALARAAIEDHWRERPASADTVSIDWPGAPAGVYVTLTRGRETRACVGSPAPTRAGLVETVRSLAVLALSADRRRPPVRRDELERLGIAISFTDQGEPVTDPMLVDPGREGLLVTSSRGSVAFLPGEARTIRWALDEARRAGVLKRGDASVSYRRLRVVNVAEPAPSPAREEEDDESATDAP